MTTSNSLTNDELLGISDLPSELLSTDINPKKSNRNYYKLTPEILLSKRGLPNLIDNLGKFKFLKRNSKILKSSRINRVNKFNKIGSEHHYQNLTNLLHVYQSWGHSIYPKYKFKDFIKMLGRNSEFIECKNFLKDKIRNEMIEKRSKINNNGVEVGGQADAEVNVDVEFDNSVQNYGSNNDSNKINDSENEEWPELFGGNSMTIESSKNSNAHMRSDSDSESESEELKINPTPKFSAILRTSSQAIAIQTENENIALSDDEFAGNELQDFLSDLDEENEENDNKNGNKNGNKNNTDKDITMGLSQHMAKDSADKIGNDDDDDDDDDEFEILRTMDM